MWLFGFSVAKAGEHVMYSDALTSFGFALDAECKNNPSTSLLEALASVRPKRDKPMDLTTLNCATLGSAPCRVGAVRSGEREYHHDVAFGFSVGQSGGHLFDTGRRDELRRRAAKALRATSQRQLVRRPCGPDRETRVLSDGPMSRRPTRWAASRTTIRMGPTVLI